MAQSRGHRPGGGASTASKRTISDASRLPALSSKDAGGSDADSSSKRDSGCGVTLDELLETGHGHIVRYTIHGIHYVLLVAISL